MTPWITRVAVVSTAGWGVDAMMDALCAEPRLCAPSPEEVQEHPTLGTTGGSFPTACCGVVY